MSLITAHVVKFPPCCICKEPAQYDGVTFAGRWGFFCTTHWYLYTPGKLGLGVGQKLVLKEKQ